MTAAITASIELACERYPTINYIPQHEVLERAKADLRFEVEIPVPRTKKAQRIDLIPDAIFGLEYVNGNQKSYRFFVVEADRGTEPSRSSKFNRKSHWRNFMQYREYIGHKLYKEHLGLKSGLMVLNVTKDKTTQSRMIKLADEIFERGNSYMLFTTLDEFSGYFRPISPIADLLSRPWQRSGMDDFFLDES